MRREGRRIDDKVSPRHQRRIGRPAKGCWACGTPCTEHEPAPGPWSRSAPGRRRRKAAHRRVPDSDGKADWSSGRQLATSALRVLPRPAELSLPAPSWVNGAPLSLHCVMAIRPPLTQLGTDKARLLPREMGQCDQTAPTATKEPITRRGIADEIDDNDDDSQASQLPSVHLDSRHILAAQRVRPCLRIRRLGVRN